MSPSFILVDQEVNLPEKRRPRRFMVDRDVNLPEERCPRRFRVDQEVNHPEAIILLDSDTLHYFCGYRKILRKRIWSELFFHTLPSELMLIRFQ